MEAVADGDTIRVLLRGERVSVRLIGVDTPELSDHFDRDGAAAAVRARGGGLHPRTTCTGREVELEYDGGMIGATVYGRTLAYVFLADGTFFNRELVRRGLRARLHALPVPLSASSSSPTRRRPATPGGDFGRRRAGR